MRQRCVLSREQHLIYQHYFAISLDPEGFGIDPTGIPRVLRTDFLLSDIAQGLKSYARCHNSFKCQHHKDGSFIALWTKDFYEQANPFYERSLPTLFDVYGEPLVSTSSPPIAHITAKRKTIPLDKENIPPKTWKGRFPPKRVAELSQSFGF